MISFPTLRNSLFWYVFWYDCALDGIHIDRRMPFPVALRPVVSGNDVIGSPETDVCRYGSWPHGTPSLFVSKIRATLEFYMNCGRC